ncbi:MAG: NADH-quinone oxidoreductase subunit M [Planctomycetota bacterium]|nr:MAG: NADH-quinone oxidoreductase subunit M [Planctomycetota bacterium]
MNQALLPLLLGLPLAGAFLVLLSPAGERLQRWIAMAVALATAALGIQLFVAFQAGQEGFQFTFQAPWFRLPGAGEVQIALGVDGISVLMVTLSALLVPIVLLVSPGHILTRTREYLFWLLLMEAGMLGVFLALDLVLFYVFWELSLIPLYFIIGIWGGENRIYATIKFVLYTLVGSLVMLVGLIRVALDRGTTDVAALLRDDLDPELQRFAFACFALSFLIKVPVVPFHTWLPDAHVQAPAGGSVILAGVMLKMGTYGLLRYGVQMFPAAAVEFAPWLAVIGVVGIVYGSLVAWAQRDFKKLVAYSSVAHLGFVVLGSFALNVTALQGAVLQGVNHGISTGALFLLVGVLYDRRHTRELAAFGGLARTFPAYAFLLVIATLASVGLPGTNGFVGELLILLGAFRSLPWLAVLGGLGVVLGAVYMLGMCRQVLFGPVTDERNRSLEPLKPAEWLALAPLCALMLWIGLYPAPLLDRTRLACEALVRRVQPYQAAEGAALTPPLPPGQEPR